MQDNLIDLDWETQPAIPTNPIITHDIQYSGKIVHQKLIEMRASMALLSLNAFVITTLDEIACTTQNQL